MYVGNGWSLFSYWSDFNTNYANNFHMFLKMDNGLTERMYRH